MSSATKLVIKKMGNSLSIHDDRGFSEILSSDAVEKILTNKGFGYVKALEICALAREHRVVLVFLDELYYKILSPKTIKNFRVVDDNPQQMKNNSLFSMKEIAGMQNDLYDMLGIMRGD